MPVGGCDLRTRVLGAELSLPVLLAPVGYSRLMHPEGERAAARAAGEAGTAYILSTISGHKLEDVRAASRGPVWYQLYLLGGRPAAEGALDRAQRAGFGVLVITIDTATLKDATGPSIVWLDQVQAAPKPVIRSEVAISCPSRPT